jgi:hypothetical protein
VAAGERVEELMRGAAEATEMPDAIPLELAELLSPYAKNKRFTLRVERMPERARLSRGRNNGDRSWSLMRDELEDLLYLPPKGMNVEHTLAIRIIGLDGDNGATLAVHDLLILPGNAVPLLKPGKTPEATGRVSAELRKLRDELAEATAALDERERELAAAQQDIDEAWAEESQHALAAELSAARAAWQAELEKRLAYAAAEAAEKLETSRAAWAAEQKDRLAETEELTQQRIDQAREHWQHESRAALLKAEKTWKADEAAGFARAEARWREQSAATLADAVARCERAEAALSHARSEHEARHDAAIRHLHSELAAVQDILSDCERDLAEARSAADRALERSNQEAGAALQKAEMTWKAGEAARIAQAEARWREHSALALAEATARFERAEAALAGAQRQTGNDRDLGRLREELAAAQTSLSDRERKIAEARSAIDQAHNRWQQETEAALSKAQKTWKEDEAARLANAEGAWHRQSAHALAEATGRYERAEAALARARTVRDAADTVELRQLRNELAELKSALNAREHDLAEARHKAAHAEAATPSIEAELTAARTAQKAELDAQAQRQIDDARASWKRELDDVLSRAEKTWKADEAIRLANAETFWREQSAGALAEATVRYERAEAALRGEPHDQAEREPDDNAELLRLRRDLDLVQAAVSDREARLALARSEAKLSRERWKTQAQAALRKTEEAWEADEAYRFKLARAQWEKEAQTARAEAAALREQNERQSNHLVRDSAIAACLAVTAMFFLYPTVEPMIVEIWSAMLPSATESAPQINKARPQLQAALPRDIVSVHVAKIRATDSVTAPIVASLARGTEVIPIEQRGSWERIRTIGSNGSLMQEGWVSRASLKDASGR